MRIWHGLNIISWVHYYRQYIFKAHCPQNIFQKPTARSNQPGSKNILPAVSNMVIDKTWQRWEIMCITPLTAPDWCHWWQIKAVSLSRSQSEIHYLQWICLDSVKIPLQAVVHCVQKQFWTLSDRVGYEGCSKNFFGTIFFHCNL